MTLSVVSVWQEALITFSYPFATICYQFYATFLSGFRKTRSAHMTHKSCDDYNNLYSSKRRQVQASRQASAKIKQLAEDSHESVSRDTHVYGRRKKRRRSLRSARHSTDLVISQEQAFQDPKPPNRCDTKARLAYTNSPGSDEDSNNGTWQGKTGRNSDNVLEFPLRPQFLSDSAPPSPSVTIIQDGVFKRRSANMTRTSGRDTFSPDRFVSSGGKDPLLSGAFRIGRNTKDLTRSEKLLRHCSASPDPFGPRVNSRRREQSFSSPDVTRASFRGPRPQPRILAANNATTIAQGAPFPQSRQVSAGAVWNVGGSARSTPNGPVRAVSDGRGAFISSGSNAPMYTAEFLKKPNSEDEMINLGDRIAVALDIDRVSRMVAVTKISHKRRSASTGSIGIKSRKSCTDEPTTRWVNGQWIKPAQASKYCQSPSGTSKSTCVR